MTLFSALAGAAELIPVPFVDDYTRRLIRRRMVREIFGQHGGTLGTQELELLSNTASTGWLSRGCLFLLTVPLRITAYVLRKLFRKLFFILALRKAAEETVQVFHEGYLLEYAFRQSLIRLEELDEEILTRLRWAMSETIREFNPLPIREALRRLFRSAQSSLIQLSASLQQERETGALAEDLPKASTRGLDPLLDRVEAELWNHPDYLRRLEARFEARFRRGPAVNL